MKFGIAGGRYRPLTEDQVGRIHESALRILEETGIRVEAAEAAAAKHSADFQARRRQGYYEIVTASASLWQELYLYGQMLAQAQDEHIDGGEVGPH